MLSADLILRAKTVSGPEALALGLVTEVWPNSELKQRAIDLARELAETARDRDGHDASLPGDK